MTEGTTPNFEAVLQAARANERDAWHSLYSQFSPAVLAYLRSQRVAEPEDLLGDVWLNVVRDIDRFSGDGPSFRSWLLRIAHNRLVDAHRAAQRRPTVADTAADDPDSTAGSEEPARSTSRVALDELESLLATLPDSQRAVLVLRFVLDLSQRDTAQVLGMSVPAVKMLQLRATRNVARALPSPTSGRWKE